LIKLKKKITEPLSKLLRKGAQWEWGTAPIQAINVLRHLITNAPILCYFDPTYSQFSKLYIPGSLRQKLIERYHDLPISGHQGIATTVELISRKYYWQGMTSDITRSIRSCDTCQRFYTPSHKPAGFLQPLPIPEDRFKSVSMDFFDMPTSDDDEHDTGMVIIDRLTKYTVIVPCHKKGLTGERIAEMFLSNWVCRGIGLPSSLISDRDSKLMTIFWREECKNLQVTHSATTARHQQENGLAESAVKIVKRILRKLSDRKGKDWIKHLPFTEFAINNSISSGTGFSPYFLTFCSHPRFELEDNIRSTSKSFTEFYKEMRYYIIEAQLTMQDSQERQMRLYNMRRRAIWVPGWLFLNTNPLKFAFKEFSPLSSHFAALASRL
jgi:hypothetical protein